MCPHKRHIWDAYRQQGGAFEEPEFREREGDSTAWAREGEGARRLLPLPSYRRETGLKLYELNDHLGNVRAVVSDIKLPHLTIPGEPLIFVAELQSHTHYYPFGMGVPGGRWIIQSQGGHNHQYPQKTVSLQVKVATHENRQPPV